MNDYQTDSSLLIFGFLKMKHITTTLVLEILFNFENYVCFHAICFDKIIYSVKHIRFPKKNCKNKMEF